MIELTMAIRGIADVNAQLERLKMPLNKRKWVHGTLARKIRVFSRARIRGQHDLDGSPWQARKIKEFDKTTNRQKKMLVGLGKRMRASGDVRQGKVDWVSGKVAGFQQHGGEEHWDAAKAEKIYGRDKYKSKATSSQALRLLKLGYKIRKGKRWVRPSKKHITSTMTMGQAGFIIKLLRGDETKTSWHIPVAARPFLGVTDNEQRELLLIASKTIVGLRD